MQQIYLLLLVLQILFLGKVFHSYLLQKVADITIFG